MSEANRALKDKKTDSQQSRNAFRLNGFQG